MKLLLDCTKEKISCFSGVMLIISIGLFVYFLLAAYFLVAVPSEENPLVPCTFFAHTSCIDLAMSFTWGSLTVGVITLIVALLTNPSPYKNSDATTDGLNKSH